jgi:hypothetical protein
MRPNLISANVFHTITQDPPPTKASPSVSWMPLGEDPTVLSRHKQKRRNSNQGRRT